MKSLVVVFLLTASTALAVDPWKVSITTLAGSTFADAATSIGKPERNPALRDGRGNFGVRGCGIKAAGAIGITGLQLTPWGRRHRKAATVTNFALSVLYGSLAFHNSRL